MGTIKKYGLRTSLFLAKNKIENKNNSYENYIKKEDTNSVDLPKLFKKPLISVILYAEGDYEKSLESIKNQTNYDNFEIIVVSNSDIECNASAVIVEYGCDKNYAFKLGLDVAQGEYVAFADGNMILSNIALYYMVRQLLYDDYDIIYSDEDIIENGVRKNPFFKPGWSPDTLRSFNYIGFALIKKELTVGFKNYYSLLRELSYEDINAVNVERVLVHYSKIEREEAKEETYRGSGKVSIIIPSKDNYNVLKRCILSIREKTKYKNYEIIVSDNGSSEKNSRKAMSLADKYIYEKCEFNFSKMCNLGAERAEGEFLLFLNDDIEIISENWLDTMLWYASKPKTGAVGCKLIYPESNKIQHCGVINIHNGPVHCFQSFDDNDDLYFGRNKYAYNYSSVTGACLLIEKSKFKGFDESFPVAYNDVDLCLGLIENGYYNVVVNSVKMYHYESLSRGDDRERESKLLRLYGDRERLNKKHGLICYKDEFYNRNLTQHRADFCIESSKYINRGRFARIVLNPESFESDKINGDIEFVTKGDIVTVGGYAYVDGAVIGAYVAVMTRSDVAVPIEANAEIRQDVSARNVKNVNLCGFSVNIDTCMFERGNFPLGIMLVNKITGKKYFKHTNWILECKG